MTAMRSWMLTGLVFVVFAAPTRQSAALQLTVCPNEISDTNCDFSGSNGIQAAVDKANNGDTIVLRAGSYTPEVSRDVQFQDLVIPGFIVVENKIVSIVGEGDVTLDGSEGLSATALVIKNADLSVENLEIVGFKVFHAEDNRYDGHGIFVIDSKVRIENVKFAEIEKMSVSVRGTSDVSVAGVQFRDGHIGLWAREDSRVSIYNCVFSDNESAAIAAYAESILKIRNSVFDRNFDDAIYAGEAAQIEVVNSLLINNSPYALHAADSAAIDVSYSLFYGNAANVGNPDQSQNVRVGQGILYDDPKADLKYRPLPGSPLGDNGAPDIRDSSRSNTNIGLTNEWSFWD